MAHTKTFNTLALGALLAAALAVPLVLPRAAQATPAQLCDDCSSPLFTPPHASRRLLPDLLLHDCDGSTATLCGDYAGSRRVVLVGHSSDPLFGALRIQMERFSRQLAYSDCSFLVISLDTSTDFLACAAEHETETLRYFTSLPEESPSEGIWAQRVFETENGSFLPYEPPLIVTCDKTGRMVSVQQGTSDLELVLTKTGARVASSMKDGWYEFDGAWRYLEDGEWLASGWHFVGGRWFSFDARGVMKSGWQWDGSHWYWFADVPSVQPKGLTNIDGFWYYFGDDGTMQVGDVRTVNGIHVFNENGTAQPGWIETADSWAYATENGAVMRGWLVLDGRRYYLDERGMLVRGWQDIDNLRYHFDDTTGVMSEGWTLLSGKYRFFQPNGQISTGWTLIDGHWYYFEGDNGEPASGWRDLDGNWYYFQVTGQMHTGWLYQGNVRYFLGEDGKMARNTWVWSDEWCWVDANGRQDLTQVRVIDTPYYVVRIPENLVGTFTVMQFPGVDVAATSGGTGWSTLFYFQRERHVDNEGHFITMYTNDQKPADNNVVVDIGRPNALPAWRVTSYMTTEDSENWWDPQFVSPEDFASWITVK